MSYICASIDWKMKVLKFGGTSIGTPDRMRQVAGIVANEPGAVVVLSAVAGTTDRLVDIADDLFKTDRDTARTKIASLGTVYGKFIGELYTEQDSQFQAQRMLNGYFDFLNKFVSDVFTSHEEKEILAVGELISTNLFAILLTELNVHNKLIPALDFMRLDHENEPDSTMIARDLPDMIGGGDTINITQGFICRNAFGRVDNLKRGGSDYTASLIGAALDAEEIQIWTDIDGMHNNDPRFVENTSPITHMSFDEAAELAYFGAKILHPASIRPAADANISVRLKNTLDPSATGTLISEDVVPGDISAIAAKDGITAIKIKSGRMLLAYGFLRSVFEVFERYRTAIDMITTSEVAVSLTIDDETNLAKIIAELEAIGTVEVDREQTIVCVVGNLVADRKGIALRVFSALEDVPVRMISYGGSRHNISMLVHTSNKADALNALHRGLFAEVS